MTTLPRLPRLHNGDKLNTTEFMTRYKVMQDVKAELINGEVYMSSPVSLGHFSPHNDVSTWLGFYKAFTCGVDVGDNGTVNFQSYDVLQPDAFLYIRPDYNGRVQYTDEGYIDGAPELVVEIAVSSISLDVNQKKDVYQRNRVQEYVVWRVEDDAIDWFILKRGKYQALTADRDGITRSVQFPGLWLDRDALLRRDLAKVLEVVTAGVKSDEHTKFVNALKKQQDK